MDSIVSANSLGFRPEKIACLETEVRVGSQAKQVFSSNPSVGAGRLQASTLRRRVNQRDWPGAAQELRRWVYGAGRVLPGLVLRREAEVLLLF